MWIYRLKSDASIPPAANTPVYMMPIAVSSLIRDNRDTNPTSATVTNPASNDPISMAGA